MQRKGETFFAVIVLLALLLFLAGSLTSFEKLQKENMQLQLRAVGFGYAKFDAEGKFTWVDPRMFEKPAAEIITLPATIREKEGDLSRHLFPDVSSITPK